MKKETVFRQTRARYLFAPLISAALILSGLTSVGQAQVPASSDTARFLEQSTFGPTPELIAHINNDLGGDLNAFLNEQFQGNSVDTVYPYVEPHVQNQPTGCQSSADCRRAFNLYPLQQGFFYGALNDETQQLRERVAFALGQVMVVSGQDGTLNRSDRMSHYQRILYNDAFGNFRQLLNDVTLSPVMGRYLDMLNSNKQSPNENYAREIMQLFSVGLDVLDVTPGSPTYGQPVLDGDGNRVPTYDQTTITNFARAFTGWTLDANVSTPDGPAINYRDPMITRQPYPNFHDTVEKAVLNGQTLPAGQTPEQDLSDALDNIFNHPNVAPFICRRLIQQLVTSNPSAAYLERVSNVFNDDGQGVRGDLQEVVRAILLDPEARGDVITAPNYGHLREPVLLIANLMRAFHATSSNGQTVSDGVFAIQSPTNYPASMNQDLLRPPTVFNYYPPDYPIPGTIVFGPEFGIQDTVTSLTRANFVYQMVYADGIAAGTSGTALEDRPYGTSINNDLSSLADLAGNPQQLVDEVNARLMYGTMSDSMKAIVVDAVSRVPDTQALNRARAAVYLVATSSQYQVER